VARCHAISPPRDDDRDDRRDPDVVIPAQLRPHRPPTAAAIFTLKLLLEVALIHHRRGFSGSPAKLA
jgi:hypothetical protein